MTASPHRFEYTFVLFVRDSVEEWNVDRVTFPLSSSNVFGPTSTGKVILLLMNGASENTIRTVERFFDTVTVMTVYVDIENSRVVPGRSEA